MTTHHETSSNPNPDMTLMTLKDSNEMLAEAGQDIRGRTVVSKDGEKAGKVDALLVDTKENKVRFMRVESGGFLGIGEKKVLIPVDAVTSVDKDHVYIDQTSDKVLGCPAYDPELIEKPEEHYQGIYSYYGYAPYWGVGYTYPLWIS